MSDNQDYASIHVKGNENNHDILSNDFFHYVTNEINRSNLLIKKYNEKFMRNYHIRFYEIDDDIFLNHKYFLNSEKSITTISNGKNKMFFSIKYINSKNFEITFVSNGCLYPKNKVIINEFCKKIPFIKEFLNKIENEIILEDLTIKELSVYLLNLKYGSRSTND